jgi:hypothetical protein
MTCNCILLLPINILNLNELFKESTVCEPLEQDSGVYFSLACTYVKIKTISP